MTERGPPVLVIVDDDLAILRALDSLARSLGCDVHTYDRGRAFLDDLESLDVDCALIDIHMPEMNGLELQRILQSQAPHIRVIMMTALPAEGLRQRALTAGAYRLLEKPFDVESLKDCLAGLPGLG